MTQPSGLGLQPTLTAIATGGTDRQHLEHEFLVERQPVFARIARMCSNRRGVCWGNDRVELVGLVVGTATHMVEEIGSPEATPANRWDRELFARANGNIRRWSETPARGGLVGHLRTGRHRHRQDRRSRISS